MNSEDLCAVCGSQVSIRKATNGQYAGKRFRVCNKYPKCKYVVPEETQREHGCNISGKGITINKSKESYIYIIFGLLLFVSTYFQFFKLFSPNGFIKQLFLPIALIYIINFVIFFLHIISSILLIIRHKYALYFLCSTVFFWFLGAFIPYVPILNFITFNFIIPGAQKTIFTIIIPYIYNVIFLALIFMCHKSLFRGN